MAAGLQIYTVESMPFAENTYVVHRPGRTDALVIDPGLEPDLIFEVLRDNGLTVAAVLNTHGHADHIAGNEAMKAAYPDAPLLIGTNDAPLLPAAALTLSPPFGTALVSPPAARLVNEGDVVEAAGLRLEVLDVPGPSPGHVVFLLRDDPPVLFG